MAEGPAAVSLRRELREWREPARYYIMRGGRIIRRPHEDFKPIAAPMEPAMKTYEIVADEDNSYWMLLEDGIGMAKSKSRNALRRIREALVAVEGAGLVGLMVEYSIDTIPTRVDGQPRGVVQAISGSRLVVRCVGNKKDGEWYDDKLDQWPIDRCRIIEPERIKHATPWNDPSIGIYPAVDLLKRFLACGVENDGTDLAQVAEDTKQFLRAREDAQPT